MDPPRSTLATAASSSRLPQPTGEAAPAASSSRLGSTPSSSNFHHGPSVSFAPLPTTPSGSRTSSNPIQYNGNSSSSTSYQQPPLSASVTVASSSSFNNNSQSGSTSQLPPNKKRRRTSRACAQCRKQKARCEQEGSDLGDPCHRCKVLGLACSLIEDGLKEKEREKNEVGGPEIGLGFEMGGGSSIGRKGSRGGHGGGGGKGKAVVSTDGGGGGSGSGTSNLEGNSKTGTRPFPVPHNYRSSSVTATGETTSLTGNSRRRRRSPDADEYYDYEEEPGTGTDKRGSGSNGVGSGGVLPPDESYLRRQLQEPSAILNSYRLRGIGPGEEESPTNSPTDTTTIDPSSSKMGLHYPNTSQRLTSGAGQQPSPGTSSSHAGPTPPTINDSGPSEGKTGGVPIELWQTPLPLLRNLVLRSEGLHYESEGGRDPQRPAPSGPDNNGARHDGQEDEEDEIAEAVGALKPGPGDVMGGPRDAGWENTEILDNETLYALADLYNDRYATWTGFFIPQVGSPTCTGTRSFFGSVCLGLSVRHCLPPSLANDLGGGFHPHHQPFVLPASTVKALTSRIRDQLTRVLLAPPRTLSSIWALSLLVQWIPVTLSGRGEIGDGSILLAAAFRAAKGMGIDLEDPNARLYRKLVKKEDGDWEQQDLEEAKLWYILCIQDGCLSMFRNDPTCSPSLAIIEAVLGPPAFVPERAANNRLIFCARLIRLVKGVHSLPDPKPEKASLDQFLEEYMKAAGEFDTWHRTFSRFFVAVVGEDEAPFYAAFLTCGHFCKAFIFFQAMLKLNRLAHDELASESLLPGIVLDQSSSMEENPYHSAVKAVAHHLGIAFEEVILTAVAPTFTVKVLSAAPDMVSSIIAFAACVLIKFHVSTLDFWKHDRPEAAETFNLLTRLVDKLRAAAVAENDLNYRYHWLLAAMIKIWQEKARSAALIHKCSETCPSWASCSSGAGDQRGSDLQSTSSWEGRNSTNTASMQAASSHPTPPQTALPTTVDGSMNATPSSMCGGSEGSHNGGTPSQAGPSQTTLPLPQPPQHLPAREGFASGLQASQAPTPAPSGAPGVGVPLGDLGLPTLDPNNAWNQDLQALLNSSVFDFELGSIPDWNLWPSMFPKS